VAYQGMFAVIAPAIITGAFVERVTFKAYIPFIIIWLMLVYCPFGHWAWSPKGWLHSWGVRDFAGGIVVHISAGFSALASVFVVGKRSYPSPEVRAQMQMPHNRGFVVLGTGMLWFGWLGFNGGSAGQADGVAGFAVMNTCICGATAMLCWITIEWLHTGKPSVCGACVGAVAGLVIITPCGGWVRPWAAIVVGLISTPLCFACTLLREKMGWDVALDAWASMAWAGSSGWCCWGRWQTPT
jgi:Amt family ammonium transporter